MDRGIGDELAHGHHENLGLVATVSAGAEWSTPP